LYLGRDKDSDGGDVAEMGTVTVGMGKTLWGTGDFMRDLLALLRHWLIFTTLGEVTDTDKIMNPRHLGSDLADIRINS